MSAGPGEVVVPVPAPVVSQDRRGRELLGAGLWALAALAWVVAMMVPWFRGGVLGEVSPLEAASLLRTGLLGVPSVAGFGVLVLPAIALLLLGLAPVRGLAVQVARVLLWGLGSIVGLGLVVVLRDLTGGLVGGGAALVIAGCVLGAAALCCSTVRTRGRGIAEPSG